MNGKVLAVAGTCAEKVSRDLTSFDRLTRAHQLVHAGPSPGVIQDPLKTSSGSRGLQVSTFCEQPHLLAFGFGAVLLFSLL